MKYEKPNVVNIKTASRGCGSGGCCAGGIMI